MFSCLRAVWYFLDLLFSAILCLVLIDFAFKGVIEGLQNNLGVGEVSAVNKQCVRDKTLQ